MGKKKNLKKKKKHIDKTKFELELKMIKEDTSDINEISHFLYKHTGDVAEHYEKISPVVIRACNAYIMRATRGIETIADAIKEGLDEVFN